MPLEGLKKQSADPLATNDRVQHTITLRPRTSSGSEIIPDSEEERLKLTAETKQRQKVIEVIEVSSDSDESEVERADAPSVQTRTPHRPTSRAGVRLYVSRRRIIQSSDDDKDSEQEVIEISDSSIEIIKQTPAKKTIAATTTTIKKTTKLMTSVADSKEDEELSNPNRPVVDDSIIFFDEPRSARKPLRVGIMKDTVSMSKLDDQIPKTPKKAQSLATRLLISNTPDLSDNIPESSTTRTKAPARAPRANTKKAREAADLQKRQDYAQNLFNELNKIVFKDALPPDTKLHWSKRLVSTAGKAKFHRSKEGVQTVEIELAEKILDCEDRIRNTLSHEMCHLATWLIDKNIQEQHGKLFKNWSARVMKKRPDIHVSIKHNYDISHPFEWKCEKCAKVYGRFSNSINPDECVCGACKEGRLIPQFATKPKPDTPKLGRLVAAKPKDSPSARPKPKVPESDSESEKVVLELLTQTMASTSLA